MIEALVAFVIILVLFVTAMHFKEKCLFLERKIKFLIENFEDERKFHEECRELAIEMARSDERLKFNNERLLKECEELDEECKRFYELVEKVK